MVWWRFSCALSGGLVLSLLLATATAADPPASDFAQQVVKLIGNKDREFRAAGLEHRE